VVIANIMHKLLNIVAQIYKMQIMFAYRLHVNCVKVINSNLFILNIVSTSTYLHFFVLCSLPCTEGYGPL
jgi:hypothetical protein